MGLPKIGVQAVVENSDGYLKAIKAIESANDSAVDSVKATAKGFDVLNDTTDYARDVQNRYADALGQARAGLETTTPQVDNFKESISAAALAVGAGEAAFAAVAKVISFVGNVIGDVIKRVVDLGKHIFDSGLDFSKTMANISAVTNKTGTDLHNLGKELIDIGSTAVAGPKAVADAYYDVASGITKSFMAMDVLKDAVATAEAGQADLTATTNGLISVVNAYDYGIDSAAMASNVFTQTVNKGKGTMDEFVAAMSPIASLAASQKVKFDELGAAISFMTQKGLTAGQAGTALQGIMTQLSKNTSGVTRALRAMGETSVQSSLANNGLAGTLNLLEQGAAKTGQNLQTLVGRVEAMKAVTILGDAAFKDYFKTFMEGIDDATSKAREIQRLDVGAQLQLINSRFEGIGLSISQAVLPALGKFLKFVTDSMSKFDWKKIGAGLDKVGEKLGESVGKLTSKLGDMLMNVDWDQVATDVESAFDGIADAIGNIDWNAVITGIQGFVAGIQQGVQSIGDFFTGIGEFVTGVQDAWNGLINFIYTIADGIGQILAAGIENGKSIVEGAVQHVKDGVNAIWMSLFGPEGSLTTAINNLWAAIGPTIETGAEAVRVGFETIVNNVGALWSSFFGPAGIITAAVADTLASAVDIVTAAQAAFSGAVQGVIDAAMGVWNTLSALITGPVQSAWDTVVTTVEAAQGAVKAAFGLIATAIINALQPAVRFIAGIADTIAQIGNAISHLPGGGGGLLPGSAGGGDLQEGLNIVGEKGAEAIWKAGNSATVFTAAQTRRILSSGASVTPNANAQSVGLSKVIAQAMPINVPTGDTYNNTNSTMNVNFNGVQNGQGAIGTFALMKATGKW